MPLPQDISPINPELSDLLRHTGEMDWIPDPFNPELGSFKLLWTSAEKNSFAVIFRWLKGYVAPQHKHLGASHTFILKGKLAVRDMEMKAGDYVYEPTGMIHGATEAVEDTEYLFIMEGALILFGEDDFTGYISFEEMERMADAHRQAA